MPRVILPPVLLGQLFAISFAKARLCLPTSRRLSVTSVVLVSVAEHAQSTKGAKCSLTGIVHSSFLLKVH